MLRQDQTSCDDLLGVVALMGCIEMVITGQDVPLNVSDEIIAVALIFENSL